MQNCVSHTYNVIIENLRLHDCFTSLPAFLFLNDRKIGADGGMDIFWQSMAYSYLYSGL